MMKICHKCKTPLTGDKSSPRQGDIPRTTGRQELCPCCGAYLHCCRNCLFYEPGAYNDCREPQAERVLDKQAANFCDYFTFKDSEGKNENKSAAAQDKLEGLFKE
ncbi:MAG TPA: hypothetical protein PKZ12_04405 [Smithellaceae bacterium]|nr:hypothetical protein [Smithellaceae bacterium]